MNDLNRAIGDITSIRRQMARTAEFRGYGPLTLACTGIFALLAAAAQTVWLPDPANHILSYLAIWSTTALLSASLIAVRTYNRSHRIHSGMADAMIRMAVEQFLPSAAGGFFLTIVLARFAPAELWMLPGLWQIIFSLGVFSSCRFLPRPMLAAGAWYFLTGLVCIGFGGSRSFSPWAMGIPFGGGQLLVAAILLFCSRERAGDE